MAISTVSPGYSALAVNADGQIFFAAAGQVLGGGVNLRVAEFNKYGTVDSSFGTSGTASTGTISGDGIGVVLEIELNGQIVIGAGGSGSSGHFILGRFNANGSKDTTFGSDGVEIGAAEGGGLAMVTASNGETILIGKLSSGNGIILQEFGTLAKTFTYYVEYDADDNVSSITDSSGNVLERYSTDPYGNVTVLNANATVRGDGTAASSFYGWMCFDQGLQFSVITGLYYNRDRQTLDPALGRFLQPDPTEGLYVNGLDLYQDRLSNPVNKDDPHGLWVVSLDLGCGLTIPGFGLTASWSPITVGYNSGDGTLTIGTSASGTAGVGFGASVGAGPSVSLTTGTSSVQGVSTSNSAVAQVPGLRSTVSQNSSGVTTTTSLSFPKLRNGSSAIMGKTCSVGTELELHVKSLSDFLPKPKEPPLVGGDYPDGDVGAAAAY